MISIVGGFLNIPFMSNVILHIGNNLRNCEMERLYIVRILCLYWKE